MYAVIRIGTDRVMRYQGKWHDATGVLAQLLEGIEDEDPVSGADPQPDVTLARIAAERLGGEVIDFEYDKHPPGLVY